MEEMLTTRRMTRSDISAVSKIHCSSWNPGEFSVKLGERFVKRLYSTIAISADAFTYLIEKDGKIIAYSSGFEHYHRFNQHLMKSNLIYFAWVIFIRFFAGPLTIIDIFNALNESKKLRKLHFPDVHWGFAALANQYKGTLIGKDAFALATKAVFSDLRQAGHPGCWGPCDEENIAMKKWLERLGFERIDSIQYIGRRILIFEKVFDQ